MSSYDREELMKKDVPVTDADFETLLEECVPELPPVDIVKSAAAQKLLSNLFFTYSANERCAAIILPSLMDITMHPATSYVLLFILVSFFDYYFIMLSQTRSCF